MIIQEPWQLKGDAPRAYEDHKVRVRYSGEVPDMFEPGGAAVVEGRLDEAGIFRASALMTNCASKYESREISEPESIPLASETAQ